MAVHTPNVLVVEDNQTTALIYQSYLERDYHVTIASSGGDALDAFKQGGFSLVLLDLTLPDTDGITLLKAFREIDSTLPIIIVTADYSNQQVMTALRNQANDYLTKPIERTRLQVSVSNALREFDLKRQLTELTGQYDQQRFHSMVGRSARMHAIFDTIRSAANSKASIFITGESGTGKELCAEAVHLESDRRHQPFIALNCAAIPRELLESELFGHVRGAFTGANKDRIGAAQRANGGTLFLDEIGELPIELQSKLLRFIQTQRLQPVGSNELIQVDVRFICATNRDPKEAVAQGLLREDLYYRLNVIPIHLPPLRERGDDALLIAREFLLDYAVEEQKQFERFSPAVEAVLASYPWPGNIRELSNVVRKMVVLNEGDSITPAMLPAELLQQRASSSQEPVKTISSAPAVAPIQPLWQTEKAAIEAAINACHGNIRSAAELLEVSPSTIYRKMERWQRGD